jgi:hypothetical protein
MCRLYVHPTVLISWNLHHTPIVTKFSSDDHGREIIALQQETATLRLSPLQMKALDELGLSGGTQHRFVAPPFMYCQGAAYSWDVTPNDFV